MATTSASAGQHGETQASRNSEEWQAAVAMVSMLSGPAPPQPPLLAHLNGGDDEGTSDDPDESKKERKKGPKKGPKPKVKGSKIKKKKKRGSDEQPSGDVLLANTGPFGPHSSSSFEGARPVLIHQALLQERAIIAQQMAAMTASESDHHVIPGTAEGTRSWTEGLPPRKKAKKSEKQRHKSSEKGSNDAPSTPLTIKREITDVRFGDEETKKSRKKRGTVAEMLKPQKVSAGQLKRLSTAEALDNEYSTLLSDRRMVAEAKPTCTGRRKKSSESAGLETDVPKPKSPRSPRRKSPERVYASKDDNNLPPKKRKMAYYRPPSSPGGDTQDADANANRPSVVVHTGTVLSPMKIPGGLDILSKVAAHKFTTETLSGGNPGSVSIHVGSTGVHSIQRPQFSFDLRLRAPGTVGEVKPFQRTSGEPPRMSEQEMQVCKHRIRQLLLSQRKKDVKQEAGETKQSDTPVSTSTGFTADPTISFIMLKECHMALTPDDDGDLPIHIAVVQGDRRVTRKLIHLMKSQNKKIDIFNRLRQTPLHLAVITENLDITQLLLLNNCDPNIQDRNGQTCVHLAVQRSNTKVLHSLVLEAKMVVKMNLRNYEGFSPVHVAVQNSCKAVIKMLKNLGSNLDCVDGKSGRTPIFHAVESNLADVAEELLKCGADPNILNFAGYSAAHAANSRGYRHLCVLLGLYGAEVPFKMDQQEEQKPVKPSKAPLVTQETISKLGKYITSKDKISGGIYMHQMDDDDSTDTKSDISQKLDKKLSKSPLSDQDVKMAVSVPQNVMSGGMVSVNKTEIKSEPSDSCPPSPISIRTLNNYNGGNVIVSAAPQLTPLKMPPFSTMSPLPGMLNSPLSTTPMSPFLPGTLTPVLGRFQFPYSIPTAVAATTPQTPVPIDITPLTPQKPETPTETRISLKKSSPMDVPTSQPNTSQSDIDDAGSKPLDLTQKGPEGTTPEKKDTSVSPSRNKGQSEKLPQEGTEQNAKPPGTPGTRMVPMQQDKSHPGFHVLPGQVWAGGHSLVVPQYQPIVYDRATGQPCLLQVPVLQSPIPGSPLYLPQHSQAIMMPNIQTSGSLPGTPVMSPAITTLTSAQGHPMPAGNVSPQKDSKADISNTGKETKSLDSENHGKLRLNSEGKVAIPPTRPLRLDINSTKYRHIQPQIGLSPLATNPTVTSSAGVSGPSSNVAVKSDVVVKTEPKSPTEVKETPPELKTTPSQILQQLNMPSPVYMPHGHMIGRHPGLPMTMPRPDVNPGSPRHPIQFQVWPPRMHGVAHPQMTNIQMQAMPGQGYIPVFPGYGQNQGRFHLENKKGTPESGTSSSGKKSRRSKHKDGEKAGEHVTARAPPSGDGGQTKKRRKRKKKESNTDETKPVEVSTGLSEGQSVTQQGPPFSVLCAIPPSKPHGGIPSVVGIHFDPVLSQHGRIPIAPKPPPATIQPMPQVSVGRVELNIPSVPLSSAVTPKGGAERSNTPQSLIKESKIVGSDGKRSPGSDSSVEISAVSPSEIQTLTTEVPKTGTNNPTELLTVMKFPNLAPVESSAPNLQKLKVENTLVSDSLAKLSAGLQMVPMATPSPDSSVKDSLTTAPSPSPLTNEPDSDSSVEMSAELQTVTKVTKSPMCAETTSQQGIVEVVSCPSSGSSIEISDVAVSEEQKMSPQQLTQSPRPDSVLIAPAGSSTVHEIVKLPHNFVAGENTNAESVDKKLDVPVEEEKFVATDGSALPTMHGADSQITVSPSVSETLQNKTGDKEMSGIQSSDVVMTAPERAEVMNIGAVQTEDNTAKSVGHAKNIDSEMSAVAVFNRGDEIVGSLSELGRNTAVIEQQTLERSPRTEIQDQASMLLDTESVAPSFDSETNTTVRGDVVMKFSALNSEHEESCDSIELEEDEIVSIKHSPIQHKEAFLLDSSTASKISDTVTMDTDSVTSGKDTVTSGAYTVTSGRETVTSGRETVTSGRETVTSGRETVTSGRETVTSGRETVTSGRETATSCVETVTSCTDAVTSAVTSDSVTVTSGTDTVTSGRDTVTSGRDTVTSCVQSVTSGVQSVTSGRDTIRDTITSGKDSVTSGRDTITSGKDSVASGRDTSKPTSGVNKVATGAAETMLDSLIVQKETQQSDRSQTSLESKIVEGETQGMEIPFRSSKPGLEADVFLPMSGGSVEIENGSAMALSVGVEKVNRGQQEETGVSGVTVRERSMSVGGPPLLLPETEITEVVKVRDPAAISPVNKNAEAEGDFQSPPKLEPETDVFVPSSQPRDADLSNNGSPILGDDVLLTRRISTPKLSLKRLLTPDMEAVIETCENSPLKKASSEFLATSSPVSDSESITLEMIENSSKDGAVPVGLGNLDLRLGTLAAAASSKEKVSQFVMGKMAEEKEAENSDESVELDLESFPVSGVTRVKAVHRGPEEPDCKSADEKRNIPHQQPKKVERVSRNIFESFVSTCDFKFQGEPVAVTSSSTVTLQGLISTNLTSNESSVMSKMATGGASYKDSRKDVSESDILDDHDENSVSSFELDADRDVSAEHKQVERTSSLLEKIAESVGIEKNVGSVLSDSLSDPLWSFSPVERPLKTSKPLDPQFEISDDSGDDLPGPAKSGTGESKPGVVPFAKVLQCKKSSRKFGTNTLTGSGTVSGSSKRLQSSSTEGVAKVTMTKTGVSDGLPISVVQQNAGSVVKPCISSSVPSVLDHFAETETPSEPPKPPQYGNMIPTVVDD